MIGRGRRADVDLEDPSVSSRHASVKPEGATAVVTDLGSTNGTLVNGKRVDDPARLVEGDRVTLGACTIEVRVGPAESLTPPGEPTVQLPSPERS